MRSGTAEETAPADEQPGDDPRVGWSATDAGAVPTLGVRRDGILPTVAAALSVRGTTLTATAARGEKAPSLHPLVQDFLDTLTSAQRDRFTGRCAEAILVSRHLTASDTERAEKSKRARRRPMTVGEARKALKQSKLTTRRIREDGDPLHGGFARPCRACTALTAHFGVHVVAPETDNTPHDDNEAAH
ncbi:YwqJ-related putative deaminase [Streptomyces sp. NBC_01016]|uniref:YwqJ-related putative deaminase n=1 Tax=Streptomyces sp. NBC_01016 TaxID=2903720 RepID=UPI002259129E|nr:YwqJ-related putative deaminase [Streptomyces sp. NBC_01016]MCX4827518.1 YwqJ-related putative deaminase [Streptomyces sp. NBC_01016]